MLETGRKSRKHGRKRNSTGQSPAARTGFGGIGVGGASVEAGRQAPKGDGAIRRRGKFQHRRGRKPTARAARRCRVPALALFWPRRRAGADRVLESLRVCRLPPYFLASAPSPPVLKRGAFIRGSSVTLGAGTPRQIARRRRSAAMLLTFCSSCRRRRRRVDRHRHLRLLFLLLLCLEASFSAAEERSAMSGKFREGLAGAMLSGLSRRRPRAALCMR